MKPDLLLKPRPRRRYLSPHRQIAATRRQRRWHYMIGLMLCIGVAMAFALD